jgi:hypothetical protein
VLLQSSCWLCCPCGRHNRCPHSDERGSSSFFFYLCLARQHCICQRLQCSHVASFFCSCPAPQPQPQSCALALCCLPVVVRRASMVVGVLLLLLASSVCLLLLDNESYLVAARTVHWSSAVTPARLPARCARPSPRAAGQPFLPCAARRHLRAAEGQAGAGELPAVIYTNNAE